MADSMSPQFTFESLLDLYEDWQGDGVRHEHIGEILKVAEERHKSGWDKSGRSGDWGQSWRAWKGKNFEKLVCEITKREVQKVSSTLDIALGITTDDELINPKGRDLCQVKRNLVVDYGVYGMHLPDADIVIFNRSNLAVLSVVSCKTSLRERIAQTAYWKLKLFADELTRHIVVAFCTIDSDDALKAPDDVENVKKPYAILNTELDFAYVMKSDVEETKTIRRFSRFESDLRSWLGGGGGDRCLRTSPGKPSTLPNSINEHWKLARRSGRIDAVRRCSPIPMSHTKMPQRTSLRLGSDCGPSSAS